MNNFETIHKASEMMAEIERKSKEYEKERIENIEKEQKEKEKQANINKQIFLLKDILLINKLYNWLNGDKNNIKEETQENVKSFFINYCEGSYQMHKAPFIIAGDILKESLKYFEILDGIMDDNDKDNNYDYKRLLLINNALSDTYEYLSPDYIRRDLK